jgi:hypothetical protein
MSRCAKVWNRAESTASFHAGNLPAPLPAVSSQSWWQTLMSLGKYFSIDIDCLVMISQFGYA